MMVRVNSKSKFDFGTIFKEYELKNNIFFLNRGKGGACQVALPCKKWKIKKKIKKLKGGKPLSSTFVPPFSQHIGRGGYSTTRFQTSGGFILGC